MKGNANGAGIVFAFARCLDFSNYDFTTYRVSTLAFQLLHQRRTILLPSSRTLSWCNIDDFDRPVSRMSDVLRVPTFNFLPPQALQAIQILGYSATTPPRFESSSFCSSTYTHETRDFHFYSRGYHISIDGIGFWLSVLPKYFGLDACN